MPFIQYSPQLSPLVFGFFQCRSCGYCFYGGGCAALHRSSCPHEHRSYASTIYIFGDRETWALLREIPRPSAAQIARARACPDTPIDVHEPRGSEVTPR